MPKNDLLEITRVALKKNPRRSKGNQTVCHRVETRFLGRRLHSDIVDVVTLLKSINSRLVMRVARVDVVLSSVGLSKDQERKILSAVRVSDPMAWKDLLPLSFITSILVERSILTEMIGMLQKAHGVLIGKGTTISLSRMHRLEGFVLRAVASLSILQRRDASLAASLQAGLLETDEVIVREAILLGFVWRSVMGRDLRRSLGRFVHCR